MQDSPSPHDVSLDGLDWSAWRERLHEVADEDGFAETLGERHCAVFIENKPTLLVTFETHDEILAQSDRGQPMGWQMMKALGWSHLGVICKGDTWFRDRQVIGFFDRLIDDGFFEDFEQVIFYGARACGYAACAFSVAAPGATVLALQPQATLDPRIAEWDERFLEMRRTDFTSRFGYAPDMLDAAQHAWIVYDPEQELDAMHAALFARPNVTRLRVRYMGARLDVAMTRIRVLYRMLAQISAGKLTELGFARMMRKRREDPGFQFNLLKKLEEKQRPALVVALCKAVLEQREDAKRYRRAMVRAEKTLAAPDDDGAGAAQAD